MLFRHKNKTFATLLAAVAGSIGLHRFYLRGAGDKWGWLHLASLPATGLAIALGLGHQGFFQAAPLLLSALCGFLEALVLGLIPDDQWDQRFNPGSSQGSVSGWPLALLLVLTLGLGATALIGVIARTFDLLLTGGAFG
jgi:TM2 domain-containing membrane protein YozV